MEIDLTQKKIVALSVGIFVFLLSVILFFSSIYFVKTGEMAIVSRFGKMNRYTEAGMNFKFPFIESVYKMETREYLYYFTKTSEYGNTSLDVSTKDIQTVNIEFTVQASITKPLELYKAFNGHHFSRFIKPRVQEIVQSTVSKYTIEEFITRRTELSREIFEDLKDDFATYGISVSNVSIVNHDFSDEYELAVEKKKIAEQEVEKAKAEQQKLSLEAENKVKLAEYALKEKELQAQANRVESETLTPEILQKMFIEKWDGKLPKVSGSESGLLVPQNFLEE